MDKDKTNKKLTDRQRQGRKDQMSESDENSKTKYKHTKQSTTENKAQEWGRWVEN